MTVTWSAADPTISHQLLTTYRERLTTGRSPGNCLTNASHTSEAVELTADGCDLASVRSD